MTAEILPVRREEIDDLREFQRRNMPFNFSCTPEERVFVPTGHGYTPPEERTYIENSVLVFIAGVVKRYDYSGGRFYLDEEGAYLSRDDTLIVEFVYD